MKYRVFASLFLAAATAPASAAIIFQGSIADATTRVGPAGGSGDETQIAGSAVPSAYSVSSSQILSTDEGSVSAFSSVAVTNQSASAGRVLFSQRVFANGLSTSLAAFGAFQNLFETTAPTRFSLSYAISTAGDDLVPLPPLAQQAFITDIAGNAYLSFDPLFETGTMSALLPAGSYRFAIQDFYANQLEGDPGGGVERTLSSRFDYSLSAAAPVPEPATWALMVIGFGMVGSGLRRRSGTLKALA